VPVATPEPIVERLRKAMLESANSAQISDRMRQLGFEPRPTDGGGLAAVLTADLKRWGSLIREAGIKPE
jgi:tripartite-type tricarboxylate transporter receptor subunit TctC